jgi:hypothetical protein
MPHGLPHQPTTIINCIIRFERGEKSFVALLNAHRFSGVFKMIAKSFVFRLACGRLKPTEGTRIAKLDQSPQLPA